MLKLLTPIFKLYFGPRMLAIFALGIASGLPLALTASTLRIWLTESGVTTASIGYMGLVAVPYSLKFLWSPLVDAIKIPILNNMIGRRRSWLLVTQLALMLAIVKMGSTNPAIAPLSTGLWACVVAFASATHDIVIDAYRIELLEEEEQGAGASSIVLGYRIGMLLTTAGALYLSEICSWFTVYSIAAAILAIGFVAAMLVGEPKAAPRVVDSNISALFASMVFGPFKQFMQNPGWLVILLFTTCYSLGDAMAGIMTETFALKIGFSKIEIATIVKLFGFWATIAGSAIGGIVVYKLGMIRALWVCGILKMISNLGFVLQAMLGYDNSLLTAVIVFENFTSAMGVTAFVGYLSSLCNVSYTATQYALLSAFSSVARTTLAAPSGAIAEVLGWEMFFGVTAIAAIPGLVLLYWLGKISKAGATLR